MKKTFLITSLFILLLSVSTALAQDDSHGSIRGGVYVDVNGDGKCVGTGVAGEVGVANVPLTFTNSDGKLVMNHTTGSDGTFGLVSVGQSYWTVVVKPASGWKVTSAPTLFALIDKNNKVAENVNFCIQSTTAPAGGRTTLPQAGGAVGAGLTAVVATLSLLLITLGLILQTRRKVG